MLVLIRAYQWASIPLQRWSHAVRSVRTASTSYDNDLHDKNMVASFFSFCYTSFTMIRKSRRPKIDGERRCDGRKHRCDVRESELFEDAVRFTEKSAWPDPRVLDSTLWVWRNRPVCGC